MRANAPLLIHGDRLLVADVLSPARYEPVTTGAIGVLVSAIVVKQLFEGLYFGHFLEAVQRASVLEQYFSRHVVDWHTVVKVRVDTDLCKLKHEATFDVAD